MIYFYRGFSLFFAKIRKLIILCRHGLFRGALFNNVAAATEHLKILSGLELNSVVDVGANRGQFALAARLSFPSAKIFSFEPLQAPAAVFNAVFAYDAATAIFNVAIGPENKKATIHISKSDDSSSLLPISQLQNKIFAGTSEESQAIIDVGTLDSFIDRSMIASPAMLKLDVQGYELEALNGCESIISAFDYVYCECSFVELYVGQKLASDCIKWLQDRGFKLVEIVNPTLDSDKSIIQADMLFAMGPSVVESD